ncbi:MAG: long-chain fatty acid--CoA ligase [Actinomycetota bacterium]|jgi:fatty-acyl-CoA synthase|nr:MAG: fatty-acyl-CoA synthase [Acidimicrobiaceae bacterium]
MPQSTMQDDYPLTIAPILAHGRQLHANSKVITCTADGYHEATFAQVADRADKLAAVLTSLGVQPGDRVGTFMWNNQTHLEAYLAIPCMGAVLHTLNIRLFPEQLSYVINHAEDKVIIVDASIAPLLARVRDQLTTVEHIIVKGTGDTSGLGEGLLDYDALIEAAPSGFQYPEVDERSGMAMCYTSGTTGNPKGVMYSHRSTYMHSIMVTSTANVALSEHDTMLVIVPMFHANAWGVPYAAWMIGADLVFPQQFLQAAPLSKIIADTRPTLTGAVPTVLNDLLNNAPDTDMSSFRLVMCGGSAVPRGLIQGYLDRFGVPIVQGWGMTETSPVCAIGHPPKDMQGLDEVSWRTRTGRIIPGVELRITDDAGDVVPWDGESLGEIEVRGSWITGSYYNVDDPEKFHDGWLRTGDVASVSPNGYVMISDRAKDVIKSGGEWVSSVDLENTLMGHPDVLEAAVIGVPDPRWDERPMACVVLRAESNVTAEELRSWLSERTPKFWLPERWSFITEVPKTSVGKFDKKVLRARHTAGELEVELIA